MLMTTAALVVEGLASDLGLSEQSTSLLRDLYPRLSADELTKIAQALADGEQARYRKGWADVCNGDVKGDTKTLEGTCDAVRLMAGKLGLGGGRLVFTLYKKMPKRECTPNS